MRTIPKKFGTEGEGSIATLRARGLRLTGPRRLVLEVVRATESHPTETHPRRCSGKRRCAHRGCGHNSIGIAAARTDEQSLQQVAAAFERNTGP